MQVLPTSASTSVSASTAFPASFASPAAAALSLLGRLAQAVQTPGASPVPKTSAGTLTPEVIRAALLELGAAAGELDVALATALTQTGLPLTLGVLAEANAALASAPGAAPEAYALAKSLALPTSPPSLRALSAVLDAPSAGVSGPGSALPETVTVWLGLALEAGTPPEALARGLREMLLQVGRSTEHRLLHTPEDQMPVTDMRTALLRLAGASGDRNMRHGADSLASLLEGQQLLNQAARSAGVHQPSVPLYFVLPLAFGGQPGIAELHLWLRSEAEESGEDAEEEVLRVTLRLSPPKLGRVQIDLVGLLSGSLSCRLSAESAPAQRLLLKNAGTLAASLSRAGWETCDVTCRIQTEWPPLYYGGAAFAAPRTCIDWNV